MGEKFSGLGASRSDACAGFPGSRVSRLSWRSLIESLKGGESPPNRSEAGFAGEMSGRGKTASPQLLPQTACLGGGTLFPLRVHYLHTWQVTFD